MIRIACLARFPLPLALAALAGCGGSNSNAPPPQQPPPAYGGGPYAGAPPPGYGGGYAGAPAYGSNPPPAYGGAPPSGPPPSAPPPGAPPASPGAGGGLPPPPPFGGVGGGGGSSSGSTATPLDPTAAGAAALALGALANSSAPGMTKEGPGLAGTFQEGQTLAQPITIQPGKCYTFVAAGVGPQQLEIQLVAQTPVPGMIPTLGDQKGSGNQVVLGAGANCLKLALVPVPVPSQWIVKAVKGGGIVAGQAYSK